MPQIASNIDFLMISDTKIDEPFPASQCLIGVSLHLTAKIEMKMEVAFWYISKVRLQPNH